MKRTPLKITLLTVLLTEFFLISKNGLIYLSYADETEMLAQTETESATAAGDITDTGTSGTEIKDAVTVDEVTVEFFGEEYSGTYTGEADMDVPSGEGTFSSEDGQIEAEGIWRRGKLNGETRITYEDGIVIAGTYTRGTENGLFTTYAEDGSVREENFYSDGYQCGVRSVYNDGELTERTLFVNGSTLDEFRENSVRLTKEVLEDKEYLDKYVYIEGTVEYIGRDDENCYCRISDKTIGDVFFSYQDTEADGKEQAIIPNMKVGDKIRIYGLYDFYKEDQVIGDIEGYGYSFTSLKPMYGELTETGEEPSETEDETGMGLEHGTAQEADNDITYEMLQLDPYRYFGAGIDDTFKVVKFAKKGSTFLVYAVKNEDNDERHQYVISIKDPARDGFLAGETLEVRGYCYGQFRTRKFADAEDEDEESSSNMTDMPGIKTQQYNIYPLIKVIAAK